MLSAQDSAQLQDMNRKNHLSKQGTTNWSGRSDERLATTDYTGDPKTRLSSRRVPWALGEMSTVRSRA